MAAPGKTRDSVMIAIVGSGGAGTLTAGSILLEAAGKAGWYGIMNRSVGPQIRGGEAAAHIRLSRQPVHCGCENFDLLIAIDWHNAERLAADMPLAAHSLVLSDPEGGDIPEAITDSEAEIALAGLKAKAKEIPAGRENMIALGLAAELIGLSLDSILAVADAKLSSKGDAAIDAGRQCITAGMTMAKSYGNALKLGAPATASEKRWLISGNEAIALGTVRGGARFAAAYPITPATEVLEWLSPALAKVGGALVQAEDELSSINMIIGASYGGRAAVTATSGPGLALMVEAIGLAEAAEIPIVIIDVMRGGPSTGIPTKSEQSDLNIAVYGCHGDAPHIVVAPLSISDCLFTGQWAVHLAEAMQVPVIALSDQSLGQARSIIDAPANVAFMARRKIFEGKTDAAYNRYALTADGVSPMAIPGTKGGQYTADGLTHSTRGTPSSKDSDHRDQLDKRHNKIARFDYGDHWAEIEGEAELAILTWGSLTGPSREAIRTLAGEGIKVKLVAMRLIAPFPADKLRGALEGVQRILIIEQNHSGQFHQYLRAQCDLPGKVRHLFRPGPKLIGPDEICAEIRDWKHP